MAKETQTFPLERILNISASEYCASVGKQLSDYSFQGVHAQNSGSVSSLASLVPDNAEVVVRYTRYNAAHYGTALIPKK